MATNKKLFLTDTFTIGLLLVTFALTAAVVGRPPDPMPTHFAANGQPNGWMPRVWGAWFVPVLSVALAALLRFGSRLVPSDWRGRLKSSPVRVLCLITVGFLSALHVCVLHAALSPVKTLGSEVWVLMGAFFVMLGQILPRTRRNPFLGVRTTWTLTSDENWAQTHRMAGYAFTLGGAAVAVAGLLRAPALAMAVLAVTVLAPVVWLWRFAAREA